jgi:hypothetical protein
MSNKDDAHNGPNPSSKRNRNTESERHMDYTCPPFGNKQRPQQVG